MTMDYGLWTMDYGLWTATNLVPGNNGQYGLKGQYG